MADGLEVRLTGIPAFSARLRALGSDMQKKIVRSGTAAAGTVFKKAAQRLAPVLRKPDTRKVNPRVPGQMKRAVYASRSKFLSKPGVEITVVGVRQGGRGASAKKKAAFYWRFVEGGHLARGPGQKIKGGTKRAALERKRLKAGGARFVPGVFFMLNAFKSSQDAAIKAFNARVEARIEKAQKELNER